MAPLRHENIVRLFGGAWNEGADKLCIVLELCLLGSLRTFLRGREKKTSWEELRHGLALDAARGLEYLHHNFAEPLIHRDIKPGNILIQNEAASKATRLTIASAKYSSKDLSASFPALRTNDSFIAKLADFGETRRFDVGASIERKGNSGEEDLDVLTMTMVGTEMFCAPEIVLGKQYNESVDTFSFALVLLCLADGDIDYVRKARTSSHSRYYLGYRPPIPEGFLQRSPHLVELIKEMWDGDYRMRPSLQVIVPRLEACGSLDTLVSSINEDGVVSSSSSLDVAPPLSSAEASPCKAEDENVAAVIERLRHVIVQKEAVIAQKDVELLQTREELRKAQSIVTNTIV